MKLEDLEIPLKEYKGIGPKTVLKLAKNKIKTIKDLIYFFPYKYQDLTQIKKIKDVKIGETAVIVGKLTNLKLFPTPKRKMFILHGIVSDETGSLKVVWYNQPFLTRTLKENTLVALYGKLVRNSFGLNIQAPKFEVLKSKEDFQKRIIPVYLEIECIRSNYLAKVIQTILEKYNIANLTDPLPQEIIKKYNYPSLGQAIKILHQPQDFASINLAKERLSFEELLYLELALFLERKNLQKSKAPIITKDEELTNKFLSQFEFKLTQGQEKVLTEIFNDLQKGVPMNRLLQGETGAGKTLIAEIIALNVIKDNLQIIFMAPTEILAQQHFQRFLKDFALFDYGLGLLTSGQIFYAQKGFRAPKTINEINRLLSLGEIKILIGTHSLIENPLSFQKIGLVIIDEQQRFGVEQRRKLLAQTKQEFLPHFLSMTATPIPRTLALAFYGDLDFSYLEDKPFGQKEIKTYIVSPKKEKAMWNFVKKEINEGHQVFIICPRVEEPRTAAEDYFYRGQQQTETANGDNIITDSSVNTNSDLLYKDITYEIRKAVFEVRKNLGLGHKESIYKNALIDEFKKLGLNFETEKVVDIFYKNKKIGHYKPDFIVEEKIILELKAMPYLTKAFKDQIWQYLKASKYKLALLINFGVKKLDIVRLIYDKARKTKEKFPQLSAAEGFPQLSAEIAAVKSEYERVKKILPEAKIAMLHGKMKSEEKEKILRAMQKNEIQILVSSSVVEVGIDLPLATVIIIQSPERFGLAQLYQLRGRVGRSVHQGYCFLVPQKLSPKSKLRLKYFLQAKSALELSEYDLKLRGGGELLGERQAGMPDLAMKALSNLKLIEKARKTAEEILNQDPQIEKHPNLKKEINKRKGLILA